MKRTYTTSTVSQAPSARYTQKRFRASPSTSRRPAITRAPATTRVRAQRAELKDHEAIVAVATPIASGGTVSACASLVPLGDDAHSRDGRVIHAKELKWRAYFESALNTTGNTCGAIRFIIFRWDDDTQPGVGDVITSSGLLGVYNLANVFKLKVLEDRMVPINSYFVDTGGDAVPACAALQGSIPLNYQMGFDDSNGTQEKGGLYFMWSTNSGASNWFQLSVRSQLMYYDV